MVSLEWHARLRRSPLSSWLVALKDRFDYVRWRHANVAGSAAGSICPLQKRYALLELVRADKLGLVVETGTFLGDMAAFLSARGYDVITIELDPTLAALARLRFADNQRVHLIEGDSRTRLPAVVNELTHPTLFYLDAHYSGPGTGKGEIETPISAEIDLILKRAPAESVVAIDDARCFGTAPDYPSLQDLLGALRARGVVDAHVANDAIVFTVPETARPSTFAAAS
jgi:SAM-dependent methyltransferase